MIDFQEGEVPEAKKIRIQKTLASQGFLELIESLEHEMALEEARGLKEMANHPEDMNTQDMVAPKSRKHFRAAAKLKICLDILQKKLKSDAHFHETKLSIGTQ